MGSSLRRVLSGSILALVVLSVSVVLDLEPARADYGAMTHPVSGTVSYIVQGCDGNRPTHTGVDIVGNGGTQISAAYDGVVTTRAVEYGNAGFGNYVIVSHANGYSTLYAHMRDAPSVRLGQSVSQGDRLGFVGDTGNSTAKHLHFEIRRNGSNLSNQAYACGQRIIAGADIPMDFPDLGSGVRPSPAYRGERSFSLRVDGVLEGKDTASAPPVAVQIAVIAADVEAETVATVNAAGELWVKRGRLSSPEWLKLAVDAVDVAVDGERFVVLQRNGDVWAKDGLLSSDWRLLERGATSVAADESRIGVLTADGVFKAKSGALDSGWVIQELSATSIAVDGDRLGVTTSGVAKAKAGPLNGSWIPLADAQRIVLSQDRVFVFESRGVFAKEGGLDARWLHLEEPATDVKMSGERLAVLRNGVVRVKTDGLYGRWIDYFDRSVETFLN